MKILKKRFVVLLLSAIFATTLVAGGMHIRHNYAQYHIALMTKIISHELSLNDTQIASLAKVGDEFMKTRKAMHKSHDDSEKVILAMLEKPNLDRAKLIQVVTNKVELVRSRLPRIAQVLGNFYDGLSDVQRAKLRAHIKQKLAHLKAHHAHKSF